MRLGLSLKITESQLAASRGYVPQNVVVDLVLSDSFYREFDVAGDAYPGYMSVQFPNDFVDIDPETGVVSTDPFADYRESSEAVYYEDGGFAGTGEWDLPPIRDYLTVTLDIELLDRLGSNTISWYEDRDLRVASLWQGRSDPALWLRLSDSNTDSTFTADACDNLDFTISNHGWIHAGGGYGGDGEVVTSKSTFTPSGGGGGGAGLAHPPAGVYGGGSPGEGGYAVPDAGSGAHGNIIAGGAGGAYGTTDDGDGGGAGPPLRGGHGGHAILVDQSRFAGATPMIHIINEDENLAYFWAGGGGGAGGYRGAGGAGGDFGGGDGGTTGGMGLVAGEGGEIITGLIKVGTVSTLSYFDYDILNLHNDDSTGEFANTIVTMSGRSFHA